MGTKTLFWLVVFVLVATALGSCSSAAFSEDQCVCDGRASGEDGALVPGERSAMERIRDAWGSSAPSNWTRGPDPCVWDGVCCAVLDSQVHVLALCLSGRGLRGPLPAELGELSFARRFELSANDLCGEIPVSIYLLKRLGQLQLGGNRLRGPIRPEIGNMSSLAVLWLPDNSLSGPIPDELFLLQGLKHVWLSNNALSGRLPPTVGRARNLNSLVVASAGLSGAVPAGLTELHLLDGLVLTGNRFSGAVPELHNMRSLRYVFLAENCFSGPLPKDFFGGSFASLDVSGNDLTGALPHIYSNSSLRSLNVAGNSFSGELPSSLFGVVVDADLRDNLFSGGLPACPEGARLQILQAARNNLTGSLLALASSCVEVRVLDVSGQDLLIRARAAHALAELRDLEQLNIAGVGALELPYPVGNSSFFELLADLDISANDVAAQLHAVCLMKKLLTLNMTRLPGTVQLPNCIATLPSLQLLDLSGSQLAQRSFDQHQSYQAITVLPRTLASLIARDCGLLYFPIAVFGTAYVCVRTERGICLLHAFVGSRLQVVDLSNNDMMRWPNLEKVFALVNTSGSVVLPYGHHHMFGPRIELGELNTLSLSETDIQFIPAALLQPPLASLLIANLTAQPDIRRLIGGPGSPLEVRPHDVSYFPPTKPMYGCLGLGLSGRAHSQVVFDPILYRDYFCQCASGYVGFAPNNCRACASISRNDAGAICGANGSLLIPHGYYPGVRVNGSALEVADVVDLVRCPNEAACVPANRASCRYDNKFGKLRCGSAVDLTDLALLCAEGYGDRLCSRCDIGWYATGEAECKRCPAVAALQVAFAGAGFALCVILSIVLYNFGALALVAEIIVAIAVFLVTGSEGWSIVLIMLVMVMQGAAHGGPAHALTKALLFYVQILAAVAPEAMVELLHHVKVHIGVLDSFNLHVAGVECVWLELREPDLLLAFWLILPAVFCGVAATVAVGGSSLRHGVPWCVSLRKSGLRAGASDAVELLGDGGCDAEHERELAHDAGSDGWSLSRWVPAGLIADTVQTVLWVLYATYFDVVKQSLQIAPCDHEGRFMVGRYAWLPCTRYSGPTARLYAVGSTGFVAYGVVVPMTLAALVVVAAALVLRGRRSIADRWLGFLLEGYRAGYASLYEVSIICRRLFIAFGLAWFAETSLWRPLVVFLALGSSMTLQYCVRPFAGRTQNLLELVSLFALTATYAVGQMVEPGALKGNPLHGWSSETAMMTVLVVLNSLVVMSFFAAYFALWAQRLHAYFSQRNGPGDGAAAAVLLSEGSDSDASVRSGLKMNQY